MFVLVRPTNDGTGRSNVQHTSIFVLPVHAMLVVCPAMLVGRRNFIEKGCTTHFKTVAKSESRYLLNRLWMDDYCVWLQCGVDDAMLAAFAEEYKTARTKVNKNSFDETWKLNLIEQCFADMKIVAQAKEEEAANSSSEEEESSSSEEEEEEKEEEEEEKEDEEEPKKILIEEL